MSHNAIELDVEPAAAGLPAPAAHARIVIVEDEALIAADLEYRLSELGYRVAATADCADEALLKIEASRPDLVLMDINIHGAADGIQLADAVRKRFDIPVVYLTAHQGRETLDRAKISEPFGYLVKPVRDGSLVSSIEIALHKHTLERKLREREAWLSTTLNCAGDGVIVTDRTGQIQFSNQLANKLLDLGDRKIEGSKLSDVVHLTSRITGSAAGDLIGLALLQGRTIHIGEDLIVASPAGQTREVEGELSLCETGGRVVGTVFTFRDVTIRNRHEERKHHQLRVHAVAWLARAVGNHLRPLLSLGQGSAESAVGPILRQLDRVSHREALFPQTLNLNTFVAEFAWKAAKSLPERIKLNTSLHPDVHKVCFDPSQMEPALIDLALYIRDVIPQDGAISIKTETVNFERYGRQGNVDRFVRLTIAGEGASAVPSRTAEPLEQFSTSKPAGDSLDLKFFLAHSAIADAKGSIRVETDAHLRIKFDILLPDCRNQSVTSASKSVILLVEPEFSTRILLADYLTSEGYEVLGAQDTEEALNWSDLHDEPIHAGVMPSALAPDLAHLLLERPEMKLLLIAKEGSTVDPTAVGNAQVLEQPYRQEELLHAVQQLLTD